MLAERATTAHIALVPSVRLLHLDCDVTDLIAQLASGEDPPAARATPTAIVVWRRDFEVCHARVASAEAEALLRVQGAASLADVCAAFADTAEPALIAFTALAGWAQQGFFRAA